MQIPKNSRKQKLYEKRCSYPNCGKIFFGISISKYCHEHRKDEYRIRNRSTQSDLSEHRLIEHDVKKVEARMLECECCNTLFEVKLFPNQKVYARWCPEHRNEFQRMRYKKGYK